MFAGLRKNLMMLYNDLNVKQRVNIPNERLSAFIMKRQSNIRLAVLLYFYLCVVLPVIEKA